MSYIPTQLPSWNRYYEDKHSNIKLLDISGLSSSGKTEIVYNIIITHILPKIYEGINFEGYEQSCLLIDLDGKFSMIRFGTLLECYIIEVAENYNIIFDTETISKFVLSCLSRLLFVSCAEPLPNKFLATIKRIPRIIKEVNINLVIFENFFAYRLEIDYELIVKEIERLIKEYNISIVITRPKQIQLKRSYSDIINSSIQTEYLDQDPGNIKLVLDNKKHIKLAISDGGLYE